MEKLRVEMMLQAERFEVMLDMFPEGDMELEMIRQHMQSITDLLKAIVGMIEQLQYEQVIWHASLN